MGDLDKGQGDEHYINLAHLTLIGSLAGVFGVLGWISYTLATTTSKTIRGDRGRTEETKKRNRKVTYAQHNNIINALLL